MDFTGFIVWVATPLLLVGCLVFCFLWTNACDEREKGQERMAELTAKSKELTGLQIERARFQSELADARSERNIYKAGMAVKSKELDDLRAKLAALVAEGHGQQLT